MKENRLDSKNAEVWSKTYLSATRTTERQSNKQGKVIFKHAQIMLVVSNEPLEGCEPLQDWLRKKRCIYPIETFHDNMCTWRCLTIHEKRYKKRS